MGRLELPTPGFGNRCAFQLRYMDILNLVPLARLERAAIHG